MVRSAATASLMLACWHAPAADASDGNILLQNDLRLRWEYAETDALAEESEALTLRMRPSVEIDPAPWLSLLAEADAIVSLLPDSRNGFTGGGDRPAIPDSEALELNRLQAQLRPVRDWTVTLGRQRVLFDDARFIGSADFRQNQQTLDALASSLILSEKLVLQAGYIWQVNRFTGPRRADGRIDSDSFYLRASLPSPAGRVGVFHYDLDIDPRAGPAHDSRTSGVRLDGRAFGDDVGLFWSATLARQASGGTEIGYVQAGLDLDWRELSLGARLERLGSNDGVAFQTPLASLHAFQGAADIFATTPADGIEDIELAATWRVGSAGALRAIRLGVELHDFAAAGSDRAYGREFSAHASARWSDNIFSIEWASYRAEGFASDTDKVWVSLSRRF